MQDGVQFDENQGFDPIPEPKLEPRTFAGDVMRLGVVSTPGGAAMILGVSAVLLIAASFYLIASSVPPPPQLGSDVLRYGEATPDYVK